MQRPVKAIDKMKIYFLAINEKKYKNLESRLTETATF